MTQAEGVRSFFKSLDTLPFRIYFWHRNIYNLKKDCMFYFKTNKRQEVH